MADWYVSSVAWLAIPAWQASHAYAVGDLLRPLTITNVQRNVYRCITAGTSATTEPSWAPALGLGGSITSGTSVYTNVAGSSTYGWAAAAGDIFTIAWQNYERVAQGDRVLIASDHAESPPSGYYLGGYCPTGHGVIQWLSVNRAGSVPPVAADLTPGATLTWSAGGFGFNAYSHHYFNGITFIGTTANDNIWSVDNSQDNGKILYFENCLFYMNTSSSTIKLRNQYPAHVIFRNTNVQFGAAGQSLGSSGYPFTFTWHGGAVTGIAPTTLFAFAASGSAGAYTATLRGVDLTAITGAFCNTSWYGNQYLLDSCKIAPGLVRLNTASMAQVRELVELINCFDGTRFLSESHQIAGDLTTEFTIVMAGGAQDNVGYYSHKMASVAAANKFANTLNGFWMDLNNTTTGISRTARVEIVSVTPNTAPAPSYNDEVSLTVEYPGTAGSSVASIATSMPSSLATPTVLPTSTATWSGVPTTLTNTLDPSFNPGNQILSGGNLTTLGTLNSNTQNNRSLYGFVSGKVYFEITIVVQGGNNGTGIAIGNANVGPGYVAQTASGYLYQGSGWVTSNNTQVINNGGFTVGDVVCAAVDIANKKLWFRKNSGNWNNIVGNDPAANVGGYDLTAMLAINGLIYPQTTTYNTNDQVRINLGGTTFTQSVPSGYVGIASPTAVVSAQYLSVPFTQQTAGRVRAMVRLGKPSALVYVNPQVTIA